MTLPSFDPRAYVTATTSSLDGVAVVAVSGEIDLATRDVMAEAVFAQLTLEPSRLVLDLSEVTFMGSAGLGVLIDVHRDAQQGTTDLGIVVPSDSPIVHVLTVSGLDHLLPIHLSVVAALRALGVPGLPAPTSKQTH